MLSTMLVEIPKGGRPFEGGLMYASSARSWFSTQVFCVMSFWGVLAHSLVLCLIMQRWDGRNVALAAFLLAPLVPLVPTLLELSGWMTLSSLVPTTLATLAYGLGAARWALTHRVVSSSHHVDARPRIPTSCLDLPLEPPEAGSPPRPLRA